MPLHVCKTHLCWNLTALETEPEYIQEAKRCLHEFATHPGDAYAGIRFLRMQQSDASVVRICCDKVFQHDAKTVPI